MTYSAGPGSAGSAAYAVRTAPYALVRATVLRHPAQSAPAALFRAELDRLAELEAETAALLPALCDALYASRDGHPQAFHREVVLPLRRALHNGRTVRPALLDRLGDLPGRVPQLAAWLALCERRAALLAAAGEAAGEALAAERAALAGLCRDPALGRAVALTSTDLLRAVERAGAGRGVGAVDRRARKEEPSVLRYALRASTKTSPLSWFTAVGWGRLRGPDAPGGEPTWEAAGLAAGTLTSVVKVNRTLVSALSEALLDAPHRRAGLPHRMASTARIAEGRAAYARSRLAFAGGRYLVTTEDEVAVTSGGPLSLVTEQCETPALLEELVQALNGALGGGTAGGTAAAAFLEQLGEAGLLVPTAPVDPQHDDPLSHLAGWLRAWPEDAALADRIDAIACLTGQFAAADADRRPALLADLAARWTALLAEAGRPVPARAAPLTVLSEDVVAPRPQRLGGLLSADDHRALGELTALTELLDLGHVVRRVIRDRFVTRYGPGGSCPHLWEFGAEIAEAWEEAARLATGTPADQPPLPSGLAELAALRAELLDLSAGLDGAAPEVALPAGLLRGLGARLPGWALERPVSYAYFVQRDAAAAGGGAAAATTGLLCVNHAFGGWGRFTSRFLDALDPAAARAVAGQIRATLGGRARVAQVRPVGGFNANLHPLLVPDEIGPDRRWASIAESELELVHDPAADQVRFRLRATGELLDVLYAGFLAPVMLPQRLAPLLWDHPHGVVDFRALLPGALLAAPGGQVLHTPRLTYRHLVLNRRCWQLPADVVQALSAELAADLEVPVATAARWRALLGLPDQLFLHPATAGPPSMSADDLLVELRLPKPQFVDLGNALHLRCLSRWLARHPGGAVLEEALPAPGGRARPSRAVELVVETYRAGRPS